MLNFVDDDQADVELAGQNRDCSDVVGDGAGPASSHIGHREPGSLGLLEQLVIDVAGNGECRAALGRLHPHVAELVEVAFQLVIEEVWEQAREHGVWR